MPKLKFLLLLIFGRIVAGLIDKIQADYIMINEEMIFRGFVDNESRLKIIYQQKHAQMCENIMKI